MAYFQISDAEVRIGFESTPGTPPVDGYLINAKNFGINSTRDRAVRALLNSDAVVARSSGGARTASGTLEIPIQPKMFGFLLKARHGAPVTTGAGPNYTHTFTPTVGNQTSLTIEVKLATGEYLRATGCKIGNINIDPSAGGTNLTAVLDITGFDADATQTTSFLSGTETDLTSEADFLDPSHASISGGSTFSAISWALSEDRPLSARNILNGSPNAAVIFEGKYQPTVDVEIFGETTNTQAILTKARNETADNVTLLLQKSAAISLSYVFPTGLWSESVPSIDAETIEPTLSLTYTADSSYTIVLKNQQASYV